MIETKRKETDIASYILEALGKQKQDWNFKKWKFSKMT